MKHHYIVDGYNILHKTNLKISLPALSYAREWLEKKVSALVSSSSSKVTVVYDGKGNGTSYTLPQKNIEICFSSSGQSADDLIKYIIDDYRLQGKRSMTIVSSDKSILDYAKLSGLKNLSAECFLELLDFEPKKPPKYERTILTDEEVLEWKKLFLK